MLMLDMDIVSFQQVIKKNYRYFWEPTLVRSIIIHSQFQVLRCFSVKGFHFKSQSKGSEILVSEVSANTLLKLAVNEFCLCCSKYEATFVKINVVSTRHLSQGIFYLHWKLLTEKSVNYRQCFLERRVAVEFFKRHFANAVSTTNKIQHNLKHLHV